MRAAEQDGRRSACMPGIVLQQIKPSRQKVVDPSGSHTLGGCVLDNEPRQPDQSPSISKDQKKISAFLSSVRGNGSMASGGALSLVGCHL